MIKLYNIKNTVTHAALFSVLLFSAPLSRAGAPEKAPPLFVAPAGTTEMPQMRDRTSKHFRKQDGSMVMITSAGSLHYKGQDGRWMDIRTDINPSQELTGYVYANTENAFQSYFSAGLSGGLMTRLNGASLYELKKAGYYFASQSSESTPHSIQRATASQVHANTLVYSNVLPATDARFTMGADRRKMDWILNNRSILSDAPADASHLVFYESIQLPAGWRIVEENNEVNVYAANGAWMVNYSTPFIHEAVTSANSSEEDFSVYGQLKLRRDGSNWMIETRVPMNWLKSASRNYPVVVDPTANYFPDNVANWTGYQTSAANKTSGFTRVTSGLNVGWAKFNISSLPSTTSSVTQTVLNSYHYTTTGSKLVYVNDMNATDPVPGSSTAISAAIAANDFYLNNYEYGGATFGWRIANLGTAANADVLSRRVQGWTAIGFNYISGSTTFMYHYGFNGISPPFLEITYLTTAVDVMVNAILSPVGNVCGGPLNQVVLRIKNNSLVDSIQGIPVRCDISGSFNANLSGTLNRKLLAGAEDTIIFPISYNATQGATLNFNAYTLIGNDPNKNNDTLKTVMQFYSLPIAPQIITSNISQGTFRAGNAAQPDHLKAGDSMVYEITPPQGYNSADYGTIWTAALTVKTLAGTNMTNSYISGGGGNPVRVVLKPNNTERDSTFNIQVKVKFIATNCEAPALDRWCFVAPVPVANFTAALACAGKATNFTNTSTISSGELFYKWDFGTAALDDSSTDRHSSFSYGAHGNYQVTLTVTSELGYMATIVKPVTVGATPFADFSFINVCLGNATPFTNATTVADTSTLLYKWTFSDMSTSTLKNPSHSHATAGLHDVKLEVNTLFGCKDDDVQTVTVSALPVAAFTASGNCQGVKTVFKNNSTVVNGSNLGYIWNFGDGSKSTDESPEKIYANTGAYQVKLLVYTSFGCLDSTTSVVNISVVPTVDFSISNTKFCNGDSITFNNLSGGASNLNSIWKFENNGLPVPNNASQVKHVYFGPGAYQVTLTVSTPSNCSSEKTMTVNVNETPEPVISSTGPYCKGSSVQFNGSVIGQPDVDYSWNFAGAGSSQQQSPRFTFNTPGNYEVWLKASSASGCADSVKRNIGIFDLPNAQFTLNITDPKQRRISLTPAVNSHEFYEWDLGNGTQLSQISTNHSYLSNGPFNVQLTVTDANGCKQSSSKSVTFSVSSKDISQAKTNVQVYPNPFTTSAQVDINLEKGSAVKVMLMDMLGRELSVLMNNTLEAGKHKLSLDASSLNLPAGNYYLLVLVDGQKEMLRITKAE